MSEDLLRIRVTINRMKGMAAALESLCEELSVKNPKLFAIMAESPLEDLRRMHDELDQLLEPLKHASEESESSASIIAFSERAARGPVE